TDPNGHYNVKNIKYRQSELGTNYGLSAWCAGCHTDFYGEGGSATMGGSSSGDTKASDTDTWIRHPTIGITLSEGVTNTHIDANSESGQGYWWASQVRSRPPYISPSGELGDKTSSDNEPGCGSCHKAHGSDKIYGLLFDDPNTTALEDGARMVGTCQVCHLRGGGYYETSPHGDPVNGLLRDDQWAKGECEHCHNQHVGNEYNLYTENTNNLCYASGCHDFTPSGYPAQEEDRTPSTSTYPGYFEKYTIGGIRATGLDNRFRWPGEEVFEDANTYYSGTPERFYSPHRNDPDMPRKDSDGNGLCVNCHSPHGTENPFDMLTKTYLSTKGSWENDVPVNYELCFGCHGSDGPLGMDAETKRIEDYYDKSINPNSAGHMIRKSTKSASYWPDHIEVGDRLACSNCHNPHGSRGYDNNNQRNTRLISDQRPQWNGIIDTLTSASKCRTFCFGCHIPSDDPNCSLYSDGCPEVDGIQMAPIPVRPGANSPHEGGSNTHCGNCHGREYDATSSASPAFNVHNPRAAPKGMTKLKAIDLSPPTGLIATGGKRLVELVWDNYPDENIRGYHLYRSQVPGGPYEVIASEPDNVNRYMDLDIRPEQNYYYALTVEGLEGTESPYSKEAGATPMSLTLGQLRTLEEIKGLTAKIEEDRISLAWEESLDELVAGYHVYRRIEGNDEGFELLTQERPLKWPAYEDRDVEKGLVFIYSVVAVDKMGNEARFPREVRVAYKTLYISSVSLSQGERPLRGDREMAVTLAGSSGASASFNIKRLASHIPMEEVEDTGTYTGTYIVPGDIENAIVPVTCYLRDSLGNVDYMVAPNPLRIDNLPPPPPDGLETVMDPDGIVSLQWHMEGAEDQDITTYRIYKGIGENDEKGKYELIASDIPKNTTEYKDNKILPSTRYRYFITSMDEAGNESNPSTAVDILVSEDIAAPYITDMRFLSGMGVWKPGETISILMTGESGGEARFSIGSRVKDIIMNESFEGGKYEGKYTFQEGDEGYEMLIIGRLTDPSGNTAVFEPKLKVSVVRGAGDSGPEVYEVMENSFQISGDEGLVEGDILSVSVRGTPDCYAAFHLGGLVDKDQTLSVDWSGFNESEYPDIAGYQIHKGAWPPSTLDKKTLLATLGLGERQFHLSDDVRLDPEIALYVSALDRDGHARVILTPKWDIPLKAKENEPDIYEGEYIVQPGDRMIQGYLYVVLKDQSGMSSIPYRSSKTINIDTGSRIEIQPKPQEIKADSLSKSRVTITLRDARDHGLAGRQIGLSVFTTSEYTGLVGLGRLDQIDIGHIAMPFPGIDPMIQDQEPYVFTSDGFGQTKMEYQAGFAAKTAIFRARDMITGDVGLGYCTSYIEAQAQVEQYMPRSRMKALGQKYAISLSADPDWLTADGISTSRIIASITGQEGEPVSGHQVVFTIAAGDGRLLLQEGITDERGLAEVTYVAGKRIGTVEIRAVDVSAHIEARTYIILKSDAPALISMTVEPERIPADGQSQCTLHIKVTDINGNPSRGVGLSLKVMSGGGRILEADEITDFLGRAEAIYQSGDEPGMALFNLRVTSKIPTHDELEEIKWTR
ncbi:MAG: Ig-like domain-containing protein, partial [bacterium]